MPDIQPIRSLPPHWQRVLEAVVAAERLDNSEAAEHAANHLRSPCVVVISINRAEGTFEARCYGDNPDWRRMADKVADAALAGIDAADPSDGQ
jgi:hypothetical protein